MKEKKENRVLYSIALHGYGVFGPSGNGDWV
jgi:hypothetical protein